VDDEKAVLGGDDGRLTEWNWATENIAMFDNGHDGSVHALARDTGRTIISGSSRVLRWDLDDRKMIDDTGLDFSGGIFALAAPTAAEKPLLFAGGARGELRVLRDGRPVERPFSGHTGAVRAISVQGEFLVTGSEDGTARLWSRSGTDEGVLTGHPGAVSAVATWPGDSSRVVTGGEDGAITVWDRSTGSRIGPPMDHGAPVLALAVSADGKRIFSSGDNATRVWRADKHTQLDTRVAGPGQVLSADAYATVGADGDITVRDLRTGEQRGAPVRTNRDVHAIVLADDTLVTCGADSAVERWDLATDRRTGHARPDLAAAVTAIALMPDGDVIAGDSDGELHLVRTIPTRQDSPGTRAPHPALASDEPATLDAIGNTEDVRAVAELVTAHPTPLSVALLGDRGSGKSSTVLQVESHVRALAGNVRQIHFNAWHYSDIDLWVGLLEQIIDGLRQPERAPASTNEEHEAVEAEQELVRRLADEVTRELDHASAPRTSLLRRARHLDHAKDRLAAAGEQVATRLADARRVVRRRMRALFLATVAVAAAVPPVLLGRTRLPEPQSWLWSAGAAIAVVLISAVVAVRRFSKHTDHLRDVLNGQLGDLRAAQDRLTARRAELDPAYQLRQVLDELGAADAYARHGGGVGAVHQDLRRLASALRTANQAPTPVVERVVLYVDDLDRCAPARVLEVLEAVNLLLSMRVFVVVVAADPRLLCEALEVTPEYAFGDGDQRHRRVLSLLDKVFTVVYAVRPLGTRQASYLRSLLTDVAPEAPAAVPGKPLARVYPLPWTAPDRTLRISQGEADLLASLAELLPGPRAVKKLTNIYRLVLTDQYHRRTHYLSGDYPAAAIMVAGLVRDPAEFARLVDHLATARCPEHGHQDVVALLDAAGPFGTILSGLITRHDPVRCAESYRDWAVKVARYSFETYPVTSAGRRSATVVPGCRG
jgi:WD40 repeat protein